MNKPVTDVRAIAVRPGRHVELPERLATEEPMEVRAAGPGQDSSPVAVTMRTPGHDFELAAGFMVTEGLARPDEIVAVAYCDAVDVGDYASAFNAVTVSLPRAWDDSTSRRNFASTSSCGVCGKASIDQVELSCPVVAPGPAFAASLISELPGRLRAAQRVFDKTGGLHAAALFGPDGEVVVVREDVGRHNAVDKVVGAGVLARRPPPRGAVIMVSGRVSFEITQKAAMAGIGVIAAVSAPSNLAVSAAERLGVTVAGFVRGERFNVYSHPERIDFDA
ncbi:MAG TPA: formate dehydrogenase accessory sulfurtransferase FdhD [Acidimicrobiales bacterium]|jgi:FdhD protein|nr:formate dehydrogenase accessory sulfurtransferase FdhD [Acidimicrobiales bacterium]